VNKNIFNSPNPFFGWLEEPGTLAIVYIKLYFHIPSYFYEDLLDTSFLLPSSIHYPREGTRIQQAAADPTDE
jgi:hypothetical protein